MPPLRRSATLFLIVAALAQACASNPSRLSEMSQHERNAELEQTLARITSGWAFGCTSVSYSELYALNQTHEVWDVRCAESRELRMWIPNDGASTPTAAPCFTPVMDPPLDCFRAFRRGEEMDCYAKCEALKRPSWHLSLPEYGTASRRVLPSPRRCECE